ncbi:hypothetical protein AGLY_003383 [Aphis glycines]|uniref:HAT C-terminal dimerisation domain-containing protein n=1 Tax=Aphis glycines TaxID=307491 RepID=A0A6G0U2K5_APHGL|nr:hypothetical protein AGLY_003383 [Aphis glycines]
MNKIRPQIKIYNIASSLLGGLEFDIYLQDSVTVEFIQILKMPTLCAVFECLNKTTKPFFYRFLKVRKNVASDINALLLAQRKSMSIVTFILCVGSDQGCHHIMIYDLMSNRKRCCRTLPRMSLMRSRFYSWNGYYCCFHVVTSSVLTNRQRPTHDSSADEPLSDDLNSTKKRVKRKQCFKDDWIESHKWVGKSEDKYEAYCHSCKVKFSVGNSGIAAIKQHEISKKHKSSQSSLLKNKTMDFYGFKGPTADKEENLVIVNLSNLDCCIKVEKKIYKDLKMLNKLHLGRTKAESIVTEVLGPAYLHKIIDYLSSESVIAFSIQTDASNKKNVKLFPLSVQYFSIENGIENKLIDFYENPHETADEMSSYIKKTLENLKLSLHKVSALSADNTNCNFGKNHSLYTNLKKEIPNLIKANCHAHIIHNSVRHAMNFISFDIENVILKIYAHFSQSSVRRETLKDFFTFLNCEWSELKKHVVTRWLSIHPAIEIILKNWEPIKSYFLSLEKCPPLILKILFSDDQVTINTDIEIYFFFLKIFRSFIFFTTTSIPFYIFQLLERGTLHNECINKLQGNNISVMVIYDAMNSLKKSLEIRIKDKFFGFHTNQLIETSTNKNILINDFLNFLNNAINYLNKWFAFSDLNWLKQVKCVNLSSELKYSELLNLISELKLENKLFLNMNELYDECNRINEMLPLLKEPNSNSCNKWQSLFKIANLENNNFYLKNIYKVVSFIYSIPATSSYCERVFSMMNLKYRDERNKCRLELIKYELIITLNAKKTCTEIYDTFLKDEKLLKSAKSNKKYTFKNIK